MVKFVLIIFLFTGINISSSGISAKNDSTIGFFPGKRLFPALFIDPLECQINGGSYFLSRTGGKLSLYSLVNLGFNKPILAKYGKVISWEVNFGAADFSQFELNQKGDGTYLAGFLNNDFKISGDFSLKKNNHILRFRVFHLSSHLGDDYILRNNIILPNDKSKNYEQADLTYLRLMEDNYWYAGLGEIYTKYVFRKRLSFQGGGLLNFGKSKPVNLFTTLNVKLLAENIFDPDIRTAFGVSFNRECESMIRIWMEYYTGQLPYSTLKYGRVNWLGLAMWINLI
ncbi:MAG: DUF1207 domain-containing protein [Bacteroidetes bacterium]|nr:MAG: DUF1207 domain-containing protein [Bacteroidota bacterium]